MKILIAGGHGAFRDMIIDRFHREKHEIYTVSGELSDAVSSKYTNYNFSLTDEKLKFIMYSISPEAVIFLGAFDEQYNFESEQKASMDYLSGLSNLLVNVSTLNIPRFTYLSSYSVYGTEKKETLTEGHEKSPEDLRSLIIADGEALCMEFNKLYNMRAVILRFSDVYGALSTKNSDFCDVIFREIMNPFRDPALPFKPPVEKHLSPIYVSDAVDAIYKTINYDSEKATGGIYNVSSQNADLSYIYNKIKKLCGVEYSYTYSRIRERIGVIPRNDAPAAADDETPPPPPIDLTVDHTAFSEKYSYKPIVNIDAGLERMFRGMRKRSKQEKKVKDKSGGS